MISIDEDVFHRIVEKEEKLPKNVEKWFAFHRGTGRLYLVPIGEFSSGSVDGVGAALTQVMECSAVIKGHYPRYSYRRDKTLMFCGCACNRKCKALFAVGKDPDRDVPSTWEEVVTVKTRKKREKKSKEDAVNDKLEAVAGALSSMKFREKRSRR